MIKKSFSIRYNRDGHISCLVTVVHDHFVNVREYRNVTESSLKRIAFLANSRDAYIDVSPASGRMITFSFT